MGIASAVARPPRCFTARSRHELVDGSVNTITELDILGQTADRMRDAFAGMVAIVLLLVAASLATTLRVYRRQRQHARDSERGLGRTIIAEIPTEEDLVLFSEDDKRFYYGERGIDKDLIAAVRLLINGARIAGYGSERPATTAPAKPTHAAERGEQRGLAPGEDSRGGASGGGAPRAWNDAGTVEQDRGSAPPASSTIGPKASHATDGMSPSKPSAARCSSSAARFANVCRKSWLARCSMRSSGAGTPRSVNGVISLSGQWIGHLQINDQATGFTIRFRAPQRACLPRGRARRAGSDNRLT